MMRLLREFIKLTNSPDFVAGIGFLFEHIPAGAMIGMGIGFILQQLYSKSSN